MSKLRATSLTAAAYFAVAIGAPLATLAVRESHAHALNQVTKAVSTSGEAKSLHEDQLITSARIQSAIKVALFSIVHADRIWKDRSTISVCFGPRNAAISRAALIAKIETVANEWTADLPVKFDYGAGAVRICESSSSADVRVDISAAADDNTAVFQSLIGNEATDYDIEGDNPYSMQLLFPVQSSFFSRTDVFRFYVLHEFGHALGADHEHQRVDCLWDYTYIAMNFGFPDAAAAEANLENIFGYDARAYPDIGAVRIGSYIVTKYDAYSVMQYNMATRETFPADDPRVYKDGSHDKCYRAKWVSSLTQYDTAGMKVAYSNPDGMTVLLASVRSAQHGAHPAAGAAAAAVAAPPSVSVAGQKDSAPGAAPDLQGLRQQVAMVKTSPSALKILNQIWSARAPSQ